MEMAMQAKLTFKQPVTKNVTTLTSGGEQKENPTQTHPQKETITTFMTMEHSLSGH